MVKHRRTTANAQKVLAQLTSLSVAAPQVIAHRVGRMAKSGPVMSAEDQREFMGMVAEKPVAFAQAWQAMMSAGAQAQHAWWTSWSLALMKPGGHPPAQAVKLMQDAGHTGLHAGLDMLSQGLAPIERQAAANARRLGKERKGR